MNEQDFSIMDETVTKICNSLVTEPEKWIFDTYYIKAPRYLGSIAIYKDLHTTFTSIKSTVSSNNDEVVFSFEQGKRIRTAYYKALSITGSRKQQEILKQLNSPIEKPAITSKPVNLTTNSSSCRLPWYLFAASVFYIILRIKGLL